MSVLIGHASIDENGRASGGQAGDQTGKEVCTRSWYAGSWDVVLRPVSAVDAEKMAAACEALCRGNLVGYDQGQRNTLWDELEKVGWDAAKLKVKCETDCSAFVSACARCAGIDIPRVALGGGKYNAPVTQTMRGAFTSTGAFRVLTDAKYLTGEAHLKRGDVLVRESGHTAMVLGSGAQAGATTQSTDASPSAAPVSAVKEVVASGKAHHRAKALEGAYKCTAATLSIRDAAGVSAKELTRLRLGEAVQCWGYFSVAGEEVWLYVQLTQGGVKYTAFACETQLKRL